MRSDPSERAAMAKYHKDARFHAMVKWLIENEIPQGDIFHLFHATQAIRAERIMRTVVDIQWEEIRILQNNIKSADMVLGLASLETRKCPDCGRANNPKAAACAYCNGPFPEIVG